MRTAFEIEVVVTEKVCMDWPLQKRAPRVGALGNLIF